MSSSNNELGLTYSQLVQGYGQSMAPVSQLVNQTLFASCQTNIEQESRERFVEVQGIVLTGIVTLSVSASDGDWQPNH